MDITTGWTQAGCQTNRDVGTIWA